MPSISRLILWLNCHENCLEAVNKHLSPSWNALAWKAKLRIATAAVLTDSRFAVVAAISPLSTDCATGFTERCRSRPTCHLCCEDHNAPPTSILRDLTEGKLHFPGPDGRPPGDLAPNTGAHFPVSLW